VRRKPNAGRVITWAKGLLTLYTEICSIFARNCPAVVVFIGESELG
jgi:hypothetical protein